MCMINDDCDVIILVITLGKIGSSFLLSDNGADDDNNVLMNLNELPKNKSLPTDTRLSTLHKYIDMIVTYDIKIVDRYDG